MKTYFAEKHIVRANILNGGERTMFKNFFGFGGDYADGGVQNSRKKRGQLLVFLIVAAVLVLAMSGKNGNEKEKAAKGGELDTEKFDISEYTAETEKRLCDILSKIDGAGHVEVMVAFDTIYERVPAKNLTQDRSKNKEGEKNSDETRTEESVPAFGTGSAEQPYVLKEKMPLPSGVAVAASGAGSERVRLDIYEAVKALYGISGNRIKVTHGVKADG